MTKQRLMIVDDHPLLRERLAQIFNQQSDMEICGEAEDAKQAMETIRLEAPDLVIVDITLKNSSGLDLIKSIKLHAPTLPILVFSMHEESLYAERVLRLGANGYITKHQVSAEVLNAVRRVLGGDVYVSDKMASEFLRSISNGVKSAPHSVDRLTDRELEVLELIGRGRTTRAIATKLELGVATIDTLPRTDQGEDEFQQRVGIAALRDSLGCRIGSDGQRFALQSKSLFSFAGFHRQTRSMKFSFSPVLSCFVLVTGLCASGWAADYFPRRIAMAVGAR
ncbi:MAG: response regulator transcription factor [Chthoniobacter sp.]